MDGAVGDDVVIVQHQDEVGGIPVQAGLQVVEQQGEGGLQRGKGQGIVACEAGGVQRGARGLQGGEQVGEEADGVIVLRLEGEPGGRKRRGAEPVGEQGGFAEAGGSRQ